MEALAVAQQEALLKTLKARFERHMNRHADIAWESVAKRIAANPEKLRPLHEMERTGGEPDVIGYEGDAYLFCDCAEESPKGRRSLCYDRAALESRKEFKPENTVADMAAEMGIELLDEEAYRALQRIEAFDLKTSSWIKTPAAIRSLGGALFCDRRYDAVFVYHNGAESYYGSRGFRGMLRV
jgi:hypothetical protein